MTEGQQIEFEKPRGINRVEIRAGYAQAHVSDLPRPLTESRLAVLKAIARAQISLDFLKLTQSGLSFLIPEAFSAKTKQALEKSPGKCELKGGKSVVLVHAANLRDEEGLLAKLVSLAIGAGVNMEHLSDMHDRMLLVTDDASAAKLAKLYESKLGGKPA